ncbi:MAG: ABC transporter substrate-binding protein, partial [Alphaproteobacteria bacterium]
MTKANARKTPYGLNRRRLLKAGVALGALQLAAPFILSARGEEPVKIGMVNPLTGILSALAQSEVEGAQYARDEINKKGGILGRQVELLVEDSANDVGTGVQKTQKLIDRDKVDVILGDVNSGIAYAMLQVTSQKKVFHIVPGGHTDPLTGTDCKWNVFRICNTTSMEAAAVTPELVKKFGKKWFFITPDYAYGHTLQDAFVKNLKKLGGTFEGDYLPINTSDFSATLIKAKAYKPNVLLNNMGGLA